MADFQGLYKTQGHNPDSSMKTDPMEFVGLYYWTTEKIGVNLNLSQETPSPSQWVQYYDWSTLGVIGVSPVPEPENFAMLIVGLGLISVIAKRKTKKQQ